MMTIKNARKPYPFRQEVLDFRNQVKAYHRAQQALDVMRDFGSHSYQSKSSKIRQKLETHVSSLREEVYLKAQELRNKGVTRKMLLSVHPWVKPIMGVNFQECSKPKPSCCLNCHFKYEDEHALPKLPPYLKHRLELEHAILKQDGYPKEDVLKHAKKEEAIFQEYCSTEVCNQIKTDHLSFERGELEFSGKCGEKLEFQESLLSRDQEHELIAEAQSGNTTARNKLVNANIGLVKSIAKYYGDSSTRDEFISAGNAGLLKAIKKFDLKQPVKFSTYATPWIKREMGRYQIFLKKFKPLPEDFDVPEKSKPEPPISKKVLAGILLMMPQREADILKRRLAIEPYHEKQTLKEIGLHYKVSQERIRQIEKVALAKLKLKLKESDSDLHFSEILKLFYFG